MSKQSEAEPPSERERAVRERLDDVARRAPVSDVIGWTVLDVDLEKSSFVVEFEAKPEFCHPGGMLHGGMLAAMLDSVLAGVANVVLPADRTMRTISMTVNYISAARPGPLIGEGRVVRAGRSVGFTEGQLTSPDGELLATGTASVRFVENRGR